MPTAMHHLGSAIWSQMVFITGANFLVTVPHTSITSENLHDIAYGAGRFVAVGNAGTIVQSDFAAPRFSTPRFTNGVTRLTLHYSRARADYDGWNIWAWGAAPVGTDGKQCLPEQQFTSPSGKVTFGFSPKGKGANLPPHADVVYEYRGQAWWYASQLATALNLAPVEAHQRCGFGIIRRGTKSTAQRCVVKHVLQPRDHREGDSKLQQRQIANVHTWQQRE